MDSRFQWVLVLLLAASTPVLAQHYESTPPPQPGGPIATSSGALLITPRNGQSEQQQWADRYDCHRWAKTQSGFDPSAHVPGASAQDVAAGSDQYRRAMIACLQGRGYTARYVTTASAPASPAVLAAPAAAIAVAHAPSPELTFHHFAMQISGGYTVTSGSTTQLLEDGPNAGLGFAFFPSESLPIGLRVDGSYSWFNAKNALLTPGGFTSGQQDIYGGDADLQLDLAHPASYKFYLFGGMGWYRERTDLKQVQYQSGIVCYPYFCAQGVFPVVTAEQRTTSAWLRSWNAGLGWEISSGGGGSFFIEARYLRLQPYSTKTAFVPIRAGIRF